MIKRIIFFVGILSIIVIGYLLLSYVMISKEFGHDGIANDLRHNKETWQNGTYRERGRMYPFLCDSIGIISKPKAELLQILGKPDSESDFIDGKYHSNISYFIDKGDAFNYEMVIFFDSTNHANFILFDD